MRSWFVVTVVLFLMTGVLPGAGEPQQKVVPPTALLVVDIQAFYFPGGMVPLVDPEAAALTARRLIGGFREAGWPVIHIQHLPKAESGPNPGGGDPQYRVHEAVMPIEGEVVIGKHHANSFRETELLTALRRFGVERLVVAGMQTHMCVEAAVRAAADLGFEVMVAHDACATRDLSFGGHTVPAAQVHAVALAAMQSSYARVVPSDEVLAELPSAPPRN